MLSIGFILNVFVALILLALLYWGGTKILVASGIGDPVTTYFLVFCVVVAVIYLVALLAGRAPILVSYRG